MIPDFKRKLQGAIDLLFLFPRGVEPFKGERNTAIKTFLIVWLIQQPLGLISAAMGPPVGFESLSYAGQLKNIYAHDIIALILTSLLAWQIAGVYEKRDRFWLNFEAGAWASIVLTFTVVIPLLLLDTYANVPRDTMMRVYTAVACYSFVFGGVLLSACYRVSWYIAAGWTIANFCVNRETWNLLLMIQGMPLLK